MRLSGPSTLSPKLDHIENTTAAATHCEIQDTRHIPQTRFREKHSTHKFDLAIATVNVRQVYSHLPPPSHLHVGVGDGLDFSALGVLGHVKRFALSATRVAVVVAVGVVAAVLVLAVAAAVCSREAIVQD